ncbi:hypothetical protein Q7P37_007133 [Cladosporium fusiforme]
MGHAWVRAERQNRLELRERYLAWEEAEKMRLTAAAHGGLRLMAAWAGSSRAQDDLRRCSCVRKAGNACEESQWSLASRSPPNPSTCAFDSARYLYLSTLPTTRLPIKLSSHRPINPSLPFPSASQPASLVFSTSHLQRPSFQSLTSPWSSPAHASDNCSGHSLINPLLDCIQPPGACPVTPPGKSHQHPHRSAAAQTSWGKLGIIVAAPPLPSRAPATCLLLSGRHLAQPQARRDACLCLAAFPVKLHSALPPTCLAVARDMLCDFSSATDQDPDIFWMTDTGYYDDQHGLPANEGLSKVLPKLVETPTVTSVTSSRRDSETDPGLDVLVGSPPQPLRRQLDPIESYREAETAHATTMADSVDEPPPLPSESLGEHRTPQVAPQPNGDTIETSRDSVVDSRDESTVAQSKSPLVMTDLATRTRADSMQVDASVPSPDKLSTRSNLGSPLKIRTVDFDSGEKPLQAKRDSISASPTLSKHTIAAAVENGQSLPPFEPPLSTGSPQAERLPSIHQLTSSLTELAEAATQATQEIPRPPGFSHHHSQSFGSAKSQSPILANHYPASIQTSPQAYYPPTMARSPTSTIGESSSYASPPAYPPFGTYSHRRASMVDGMPPFVPTLASASSSGDSYGGYPSSGTEGYSTNHTTPSDVGTATENTPRPVLPPPPGMPLPPPPAPILLLGPYKCDVPNCNAGTFQTQYLLNSHKNVHSQNRPHYCPVAGCPRSEGGKGFKRKNEMIRHGLVHNSPGYICPFCPEREHRYPRPDNLQRHVRVHHVDKDRDDLALRDVLNQRSEGQGKTRRRRTNTMTGSVIVAS